MSTSEVSLNRVLVSVHKVFISVGSVYAVQIDLLQPWEQNEREMNYLFSQFEISAS